MEKNAVSESDNIFEKHRPWAARNGFADWVLSLIWLLLCLTIFNILVAFIAIAGFVLVEYFANYQAFTHLINSLQQGNTAVLTEHINVLFLANSAWEVLILGLATYWFVRVCSGKNHRRQYLRLKIGPSIWKYVGFAILLIVVSQPFIWFLGWINSFIPIPDFFQNYQQSMMKYLGDFLQNSHNVWFALINIALVPALCEEILFRGFVLRSFEKGWGIKVSIILSGILFGLYHIELSNLLPLASIGMLLAFLAWKADSIYPSMAAHFVNNGAAVLITVYYPTSVMAESSPGTMPPLWLVIASGVITFYLIYTLINNQTKMPATSEGLSYDE